MKLMRRIGRNIDRVSRMHSGFFAAEGNFHFTVEKDEGLFEVMAMRTGAATGWHMHVDYAELVVGILSRDGNGISVSG